MIALIENYGRVQELTTIAMNGTGSAMEAQGIWAESLEAKLQALSTANTEFWQTLVTSDDFGDLIGGLTSLVKGITSFTESVGATNTIVGTLSIVLIGLTGVGKGLTKSIIASVPALKAMALGSVEASVANATLGTAISATTLRIAAMQAVLTGGLSLGITAVIGLITKAVGSFESFDEQMEKSSDAVKNFKNETESLDNIESSFSEYFDLSEELETLKDATAELERQEEIRGRLAELTSTSLVVDGVDYTSILQDENIKLEEREAIFDRLIEKQRELLALEVEQDLVKSDDIVSEFNKTTAELNEIQALVDSAGEDGYIDMGYGQKIDASIYYDDLERLQKEQEDLIISFKKNESDLAYVGEELGKDLTHMSSVMTEEMIVVDESMLKASEGITSVKESAEDAEPQLDKLATSFSELNNLLSNEETASQNFVRLGQEAESVRDIIDDINEHGLNFDNMEKVLSQFEDFEGNITDSEEVLGFLNEQLANMEEAQGLAMWDMMPEAQRLAQYEMLKDDEEFWNQKIKNSEQWKNYILGNSQTIKDFGSKLLGEEAEEFAHLIDDKLVNRQADFDNATTFAEAEKILTTGLVGDMSEYFAQLVNDKGEYRGVDMNNIIEFLNTQGVKEAETVQQLSKLWADFYNAKQKAIQNEINDINGQLSNGSLDDIEGMDEALGDLGIKHQLNGIIEANKELTDANDFFDDLLNSFTGVASDLTQETVEGYRPSTSTSGSSSSGSSSSGSSSEDLDKEVEDMSKINDAYREYLDTLNDIENALAKNNLLQESATGQEKLGLIEEEIQLLEQQAQAYEDLYEAQKKEANTTKDDLKDYGFNFDENGDITNYEEIINGLIDNANSLSGEAKEDAIADIEALIEVVDEYISLVNDELPETEQAWIESLNAIKEAEQEQLEFISDIQDKIAQAITERLEEQTEKVKSELQKQKDLYNDTWEEEDYEDELKTEQDILNDLQSQIDNASRDTSAAGQLRLQQLMEEYKAQQDKINEMINDKARDDVNDGFDDAMDKADEDLENALDPENLAQLVAQALGTGFVEIGDEVVALDSLMTDWISNTSEGLSALGQTLRDELLSDLQVASGLINDLGIDTTTYSGSNGRSVDAPAVPNSRSVGSSYDLNTFLNTDYYLPLMNFLDKLSMPSLTANNNIPLEEGKTSKEVKVEFNAPIVGIDNIEGDLSDNTRSLLEDTVNRAKLEITKSITKALKSY